MLQVHAWFAGMEQPMIFMTHCNPSHYLLMHEAGHRYSFGHAEMLVTSNGFKPGADPMQDGATAASELPEGAIGYTDETDIMACCHGDYSVFAKIQVRMSRLDFQFGCW